MRKLSRMLALAAVVFSFATAARADPYADRAVEAAKQFAGTTINFVFPAGLGALDPKTFSGPLWEKLTGIKVNVIEVPTNEIFTKILQEYQAHTGAYDVVSFVPSWQADLVSAGAIADLDPYIKKYGYGDSLQDVEDSYRAMMYTDGKVYSIVDDGDVLVLYYRKDIFDDPKNKEEFKTKYGYDLAPPTTWKQFDEIARFFTDRDAPDFYGAAVQRNPGQLHYFFQERFRNEGGKFFDPKTMKATINSDIGVAVLKDMMDENKLMPKGAEAWGPLEVMKEWMAGHLAMTIWWPPLGRWSAGFGTDEKALSWVPTSEVKGKVGYAPTPGGHPELALGGSMALSSDSKNEEAAYLFMQWMSSPSITVEREMLPYSLRDPHRKSDFTNEKFRRLWPSAGDYLDALEVGAKTGLIDLSIRNTFQYQDALIRGLQKALAGDDPKAVLDDVAAEWDKITEKTGVDKQRQAYEDWMSKHGAYYAQ
jgi:multiple sugar transport system substrate-binding protein